MSLFYLKKLKPRSTAWRTTWLVMLVVMFSLIMSLWFFWRSFYLPELKHHARYIAKQLVMIEKTRQLPVTNFQEKTSINLWLLGQSNLKIESNPNNFPRIKEKYLAEFFTDEMAKEISILVDQPTTVYFDFKPSPKLWIHYPSMGDIWIYEPIAAYAKYSPTLILVWLLGTPLLSLAIILTLVRQLNRPLERLRLAAKSYTTTGHAMQLRTDTGPYEIRQVNTAFNHMFSSISQAEQERNIMLAGVSHDLRTPLTRMRLTAEMLPDDFFKEGLIYDIDDMDAILEQFISFMRDGSDEPVQLTDLNHIIEEIIIQFQPTKFVYVDANLPLLPLRSLSIKRLIVNLVNNAIRYGAEPIDIQAILTQNPNTTNETDCNQLIISIRDSGNGIDESQLERIMQPFERGEAARTTQGSGLGLAIVKRIASLHNGTVNIKNHPKGGLVVAVSLPMPLLEPVC